MSGTATGTKPLTIITANVNGLQSSSAKRATLFTSLAAKRCAIVCLQETHHLDDDQAHRWLHGGRGPGVISGRSDWCAGTQMSCGVGTVFVGAHPDVTGVQVYEHALPAAGRILRHDFLYCGQPHTIINVYAPVMARERAAFFLTVLRPLVPVGRRVIVAGDFNCIDRLDLDQDRPIAVAGTGRQAGFAGGLEVVETECGLVDAYRHLHPTDRCFTHTSFGATVSSGRLDRFLICAAVLDWCKACHILDAPVGDHKWVELILAPPNMVHRGVGKWALPAHLLAQPEYVALVREAIATFFAQHPVSPLLTGAQRHDALKRHVKRLSQQYAWRESDRLMQEHRALVAARAAAEARRDWAAARGATAALQQYKSRRAAVMAQRLAARWHTDEGYPTRWFHSWGKAPRPSAVLHSLSGADGAPVDLSTHAGAMRACEVMTDYYSSASPSGLFRPGSTDAAAQAALLATVKAISPAAAAACEGPAGDGSFTADELLVALRAAACAKSPGTDGLPYEFWRTFWPELGDHLTGVLNDALSSPTTDALPASMREGLIVLLYKGKGSRAALPSYRPITLLNADVKIAAKALVTRISPALDTVIDPTQTAFVHGRWIGDNILYHLHEIEYLEATRAPGCVVSLDFEKAYDRQDRAWTRMCAARMGFGPGTMRWFDLLTSGTTGRVSFNGHRTDAFPVTGGVAQGSPLSPLLFIISAQPLASFLRSRLRAGAFQGIALPGGDTAPPSHQHADDTTLHTATLADMVVALCAVALYCAASNAKLNATKSFGRVLGSHPRVDNNAQGVEPETGIPFVAPSDPVRHLGIPLCVSGVKAAVAALFERMFHALKARIVRWSAHGLSYAGRVHVAKSELASTLYFHGAFVKFSQAQLSRVTTTLHAFMAGSGAATLPRREVVVLPVRDGGAGAPDVRIQLRCLQAKNIARLLAPQRHPWKVLGRAQLSHHNAHLGVAMAVHGGPLTGLPPRMQYALRCFRATLPHRVVQVDALDYSAVMSEPLFSNTAVVVRRLPLVPARFPLMRAAGVLRVGNLLELPAGDAVAAEADAVRQALPQHWQAVLASPAPEPLWRCDAGAGLVCHMGAAQLYAVTQSGLLRPSALPAPPGLRHWQECVVVDCAPPKPPLPDDAEAPPPQWYLLGPAASVELLPDLWGHGTRDLLRYQVRHAAHRMVQLQCQDALAGSYVIGQSVHPVIMERAPPVVGAVDALGTPLPVSGDGAPPTLSPREGLVRREAEQAEMYAQRRRGPCRAKRRFTDAVEDGDPNGRHVRPRPVPATPRLHPSERAAAAATAARLHDPHHVPVGAPPGVAAAPAPPWRSVWRRLRSRLLPREMQHTCWLLLHGHLPCGAHRLRFPALSHTDAHCLHSGCVDTLETLSHCFLTCPAVSPAVDWLCDVAECLFASRPPRTAAVILADDQRCWEPGGAANSSLWTVLRCAFVRAVWVLRCARGMTEPAAQFNANAVAATAANLVRGIISIQWRRVVHDARRPIDIAERPVPGPDMRLSLTAFQALWCSGPSPLCSVTGGRLAVHLSLSAPAAAPAPAAPSGGPAPGVMHPVVVELEPIDSHPLVEDPHSLTSPSSPLQRSPQQSDAMRSGVHPTSHGSLGSPRT